MRYHLRTLLLGMTFGSPLLAIVFWSLRWSQGARIHPTLLAIVLIVYVVSSISGPILLYRELIGMLLGPEAFSPLPRKTRRHVRVRIERYASEST